MNELQKTINTHKHTVSKYTMHLSQLQQMHHNVSIMYNEAVQPQKPYPVSHSQSAFSMQ